MNTKRFNEKLKKAVLLLLLELETSVFEGGIDEQSFDKVCLIWEQFVHDFPELAVKIFPGISPQELELKLLLNSKAKLSSPTLRNNPYFS